METTYRYRLYPNKTQEKALETFYESYVECCNYFLKISLECKSKYGYYMSRKAMINKLYFIKGKREFKFVTFLDMSTLTYIVFTVFHKLKMFENHPDYLNEPKSMDNSLTNYSFSTMNETGFIAIKDKRIRLPKMGLVRIRGDIKTDSNIELRTVTISKNKNGQYYISILYKIEKQIVTLDKNKSIGLDYSIMSFYIDSNGYSPPLPYENIRKLEKRRENLRKKKKKMVIGSNNHKDALFELRKISQKLHNILSATHNKIANELIEKYDYIGIEDLDLKEMASRKHRLDEGVTCKNGRSMHRLAYYSFIKTLKHKADLRGKMVIEVPRYYISSQLCSRCGHVDRSMRNLENKKYVCQICGLKIGRDHNAAINIRNKALQMLD